MPFVRSVAPTWSNNSAIKSLQALKSNVTAPTELNVHLFTAFSIAPNKNSVAADFTEATFDGYAPIDIFAAVGAYVNLTSGAGIARHGEADFVAGSGVTPPGETIVGYYVLDESSPGNMLISELLQTPVPITQPLDTLSLDVIFPFTWQQPTGE